MTLKNMANHNRTLSLPPEYSHADNRRAPFSPASLEDVIPETHKHRTLVLCFDGTGDQFDDDNSNVVNLFSMLKKDDPWQQLVYYQAGIGTYTIPQIAQPAMAKLHKVLDMMFGHHLDAHVMSGYEFLMQNYSIGDKICIFGFSRGAYTARALAGMIHKVGLLPRHNLQQVPFAYKMYSREDETGWQLSSAFKQAFSIDVDIEFLGLWDTVASIGFINRRLPFTSSNNNVRYFRHALSLDEHRARFVPSLWTHEVPHHQHKEHLSSKFGVPEGVMPKSNPKRKDQEMSLQQATNGNTRKTSTDKTLHEYEQEFDAIVGVDSSSQGSTDVEEVWFAGCHCDVGGGAVKNKTRNALSRIPLRWMIRECFKTKTGILFHREMLKKVGLDPDTLWPQVRQRPLAITAVSRSRAASEASGSAVSSPVAINSPLGLYQSHFLTDFMNEEDEDVKDALSGINDMLKVSPGWWILEVLPQKIKHLKADPDHPNDRTNNGEGGGRWAYKIAWANFGKARHIPHKQLGRVKVHRTVKLRMEAEAEVLEERKKYVPRPEWDFDPVWVD
ncbi:hypothetical protein GYMLUDRAFT_225554 [Collybiopsis luxurians FD-317 M1]|uniref:T6SS Phospholipase effector Tle1-like catalytic domain-containing protein n=1 Tax=Collybiopsis luxurians FD-317 M1 TaxID=944289 RepID=A0A0D0CX78_9AGAR|nr:hypothetical protein GYMLUDRAFT_225554 [Collybiopsis luxurians FD-317 M1]